MNEAQRLVCAAQHTPASVGDLTPRALLAAAPEPHAPEDGRDGFLRLDMNEDLSGPLARIALPRNASLAMYPTTHVLVRALSRQLRLPEDLIRLTAGADEGIFGLMRAFLAPGDPVLLPWPTFVEFTTAAHAVNAQIVRAPYGADLQFPLVHYRALLRQEPRVAVLVTPANPTGELVPPAAVLELAGIAPRTLLIVDEAYYEYAGQSILELGPPPPNVAIIRTFSKAYGLAAARVGYVVAHPAIQRALRQVLPSYSLAGPSLALALAGLARQDRLARRVAAIRTGQRRLAAWGRTHGLAVHQTAANFVLLRLPETPQAVALASALERRGILVADRTRVLAGTLRVTVGAPRHVQRFLLALEEILAETET